MMKKRIIVLAGLLLSGFSIYAQNGEKLIQSSLEGYFLRYNASSATTSDPCKINEVKVDSKNRTAELYLNEGFATQSFSAEKVDGIYRDVKRLLPTPYNAYHIIIYGNGIPIEELITGEDHNDSMSQRRWGDELYRGAPWVERTRIPYTVTKGLQHRHLSVWASHGRYYKNEARRWEWQRPYLYCTTEDLFTQTIVVPFLIPMLEHAGAYVFSPRERDWQNNEFIVDNDTPTEGGTYVENKGRQNWENCGTGFAHLKPSYLDGENPFADGTARGIQTVSRETQTASVRWTPDIPETGRYAVYVSYATLPTSISDARYVVRHSGMTTTFKVNQKMGGGTWVYLGTFDFEEGNPHGNYVSLSNLSDYRGMVTADAVRFGGGMGNIVRGDSLEACVSGLPRYLEGARYNAQWSGMPYWVYSSKNGTDDYSDDINVRSFMTNYLAGGSPYCPADSGLNVPIEMTIALHSDAGIAPDSTFVGTLGIYTTGYNDRKLPSGLSRLSSRDLCDLVMTQVDADLTKLYGKWNRRQLFDRNYSETREPQVPSMILEKLSHQNFRDMVLGHDPAFKFNLARAVYKGVLKYLSYLHETDYVVQPLPVTDFQTQIDAGQTEITLNWAPRKDELEPSAAPKGYVVYMRQGENGYDNGTFVRVPRLTVPAEENVIYSFKVTAVNDGGESFPSEELSAMIARKAHASVLIIDGFQRVAGPQVVQTDSDRGFDMAADPGVPYLCSPGFSGKQTVFNILQNPKTSWGASGNELEGRMIAGNTFDHSRLHGEAIAAVGGYSFASVSRSAVESQAVNLNAYNIVDLILGLQRKDGYSSQSYPSLTPALCDALREFARMRGSLLVSGAYVARDQKERENVDFLRNTLKVDAYAPVDLDATSQVSGMNMTSYLFSELNAKHYAVTHSDCLLPQAPAFSTLLYTPSRYSAAVAYQGEDYRSLTLGFPFECIKYATDRDKMMGAFLSFLLGK
ncbi:MAG: hypothetical protein LUC45_06100 [Paraprevotella sp.]|nr:hypothetical protein [Paraprevotella sp.]